MADAPFEVTAAADLPTKWGHFRVVAFRFPGGVEHLAVTKGDATGADVLVRVHSSCATGDVLGSCRCDCGPQLDLALQRIEAEGRGIVLYLNQEGRGIGLYNKIRAYHEQDLGANTVEANQRLGFEADGRAYDHAAAMLRELGSRSVRLMTNNPAKVEGLSAAGIPVTERIEHRPAGNAHNAPYLATKRDLLGHMLP